MECCVRLIGKGKYRDEKIIAQLIDKGLLQAQVKALNSSSSKSQETVKVSKNFIKFKEFY